MVLRAALVALCLSAPLLSLTGVAVALDNNDPRSVQSECAGTWNRCWDGCKGKASSCYKGCNDRYDICLKIEMDPAPKNAPDTGGAPPPKGPRGVFEGQTLPGKAVKP